MSGCLILTGDKIFRLGARLACGLFIVWGVNDYTLELLGNAIPRDVPGLAALEALMLA